MTRVHLTGLYGRTMCGVPYDGGGALALTEQPDLCTCETCSDADAMPIGDQRQREVDVLATARAWSRARGERRRALASQLQLAVERLDETIGAHALDHENAGDETRADDDE